MFKTPPAKLLNMVGTRGAARREREQSDRDKKTADVVEDSSSVTSAMIHKPQFKTPIATPSVKSDTSQRSKGHSATSSVKARKAQLVLDAAKRKAKIEMQLIDMQLEANLAELEDEALEEKYSPQDEDRNHDVEQWLEHSRHELVEPALDRGKITGQAHQLNVPLAGAKHTTTTLPTTVQHLPSRSEQQSQLVPHQDDDAISMKTTVKMLASVVKDLASASAPNKQLLSRLSAPKQLPEYSGDPLEWLEFKQAFHESTELCNFTPKENLWRLRKCLRGAAKQAVSALLYTASEPCKIMSTLELQFGNPELVISRILQDIQKMPPVSQDYHKEIIPFSVKVQNMVRGVQAVGRMEYLQGISVVSIILSKLPTILITRWSDYSLPLINSGEKTRIEILSDFLHEEAIKASTTTNIYFLHSLDNSKQKKSNTHSSGNRTQTQTILVQSETQLPHDDKCQFCHKSKHILTDCKQFRKALRKTRWQHVKRNGICYKCLLSQHKKEECEAPMCDKEGCGQAHHNLLHYDINKPGTSQRREPVTTTSPTVVDDSAQIVTHINAASERKVLLKVVPVRLITKRGTITANALLDDGSSVSLMCAKLAKRAGLSGYTETMHVRGAWSDKELVCDSVVAHIKISGMDNKLHNIKLRCIDALDLPVQYLSIVNCSNYKNLMDIEDSLCTKDVKPELLIGQDNYHLLVPLKVRLGNSIEPSATLTPLGWCMHGMLRPAMSKCSRGATSASHTSLCVSASGAPPPPRPAAATAAFEEDGSEQSLKRLHDEVRHFFAVDALGVTSKPRQNINDVRAVAHLEKTTTFSNGRWYVSLPWKDDVCSMPDTYPNAFKRLKGIEKKMSKNTGFSERYRERIDHLLVNDYAEKLVDVQQTSRTWYLPHFGVDNPNKKKMRLVFDSADSVGGKCLNDYLLTGPDLLSSLLGIMLRFRENPIAVTGDIKDMFLRVKVQPQDRHAFRFLWRDSPTAPVDTYVMSSLIFGANCSPFVAQFVKNLNARRFESSMPAAVNAIYNSHYMDDYIDSLPDENVAIEIVRNISHIHREGGFEIRNWTSNNTAVLNSIPEEALGNAAIRFKMDQQFQGERTLGLVWYPCGDTLGFDMSMKRIPKNIIQDKERPTKRIMLKVIMSIFDVFGFLSPFTIQGKIMLQDTWRLKIGWDDPIPDDVYKKWCKWIDLLQQIDRIRIPRYYCISARDTTCVSETQAELAIECKRTAAGGPTGATVAAGEPSVSATMHGYETRSNPTNMITSSTTTHCLKLCATKPTNVSTNYENLQLHIFSDASVKAMCAVAYWRWVHDGVTRVAFIASKCRVVPVKPLTVPRAELQAALLAARLADNVIKEHRMAPEQRVFWCDSTTVLLWIKNNERSFKTFEANRLGEIDELTHADEWRYVPTKLNVADLATREEFDDAIFHDTWFNGPAFLYLDQDKWPADTISPAKDKCMEIVSMIHKPVIYLPAPDPQRFSCWLRLLRTTAVVLKFIDKCRKLSCEVDCDALEKAEILLMRFAQAESFSSEITAIKNGKPISKESKLLTLSPYLDEKGLLRLGGRIDAASEINLQMKRPIILDGKHPVSRLIVRFYHVKAAHGNQETVVNNLKQKYWIIRLRPTVKNIVSNCMLCRIKKCKPEVPRMGDLPYARVAHHQRPFTFCGLDLFGPMEITVGRGRNSRQKRYGVLFTCLTIRAIHIEVVPSLTTDSLIMALRRMAARRGWPAYLYSDNGTNLRGADKELQQAARKLDTDRLKTVGANNAMRWVFIPPASPQWGGAWERLIRSVKDSLRVILKERVPREEVLLTLLTEVENMVNSRPLTHVSVDPDCPETLSPNHFILGSSSNLPIISSFDDSDLFLRKQWRKAQCLAEMFWRRWVKEVLPDLLPRKKWNQETRPLQIGDFVIIVDPDNPRNTWPKGIIQQVYPGKDGRIRVVEVRTKTGVWKRSAARVARVPLSDECCASTGVGNVGDALK